MFTGLVQELGTIKNIIPETSGLRLKIDLGKLIKEYKLELGESVSINGACHTIETFNSDNTCTFFSSRETLNITNFNYLKVNSQVNLELSVTPETRMGGHFVTGHIDCLAKLLSVNNLNNNSYELSFEIPTNYSKYIVNKGSVTLNGISLTVANTSETSPHIFSVAVIPHTWQNTSLKNLKAGDLLNFEADILAKYLEGVNR